MPEAADSNGDGAISEQDGPTVIATLKPDVQPFPVGDIQDIRDMSVVVKMRKTPGLAH